MRRPGRYAHARHILVGSKAEAQTILQKIVDAKKPLKMFKKMARDYSNCPTYEKKGDLGEFPRNGDGPCLFQTGMEARFRAMRLLH